MKLAFLLKVKNYLNKSNGILKIVFITIVLVSPKEYTHPSSFYKKKKAENLEVISKKSKYLGYRDINVHITHMKPGVSLEEDSTEHPMFCFPCFLRSLLLTQR